MPPFEILYTILIIPSQGITRARKGTEMATKLIKGMESFPYDKRLKRFEVYKFRGKKDD